MSSLIIFTILCASVGIILSAPSKGHHENHGTSMSTMHQTEGPQMMGSDPTPEPEPAAKAKGLKEKSDMMEVTMSSNKGGEMMMASTESSNMPQPHQSNGGHEHGSTEASMKHDMGKKQNVQHDHGKGKKQ